MVLSQPHLLVDITSHGYGHVSQTSAVVNELVKLIPGLRITIRCSTQLAFLTSRFQCDFRHVPVSFDFGMKMANAVDVQVEESAAAYRDFHADWDKKVERETEIMRQLKPDLLLANVPYLSLAAAHEANIHSVALCCLNWADIYRHYCVDDASSQRIHEQMLGGYRSADCFLKVLPGMNMPELSNTREIQPIVRLGNNRRSEIDHACSLRKDEKLVMVAMGGMAFPLPVNNWPHLQGIRWIVPQAWEAKRADMLSYESLKMNFTDVLASCNAVITKPGYGTFTEAAYAGIPVLYIRRHDWPEEPYLVDWLKKNDACLEVERAVLEMGELDFVLQKLWSEVLPSRPDANGAFEAATWLSENCF